MGGAVTPILWLLGCVAPEPEVLTDTDAFRPDHPRARVVTTHIPSDLVGTWVVQVPQVLRRKVAVLRAGIEGSPVDAFDPPLSDAERIWYEQAADPEHPYVAWYRCSQSCRFEITDSSIWNHGYYPFSAVGSGLMERPEIQGREVTFRLHEHDPSGYSGTIRIRMNPEWTAFRVVDFELDSYRDPHLGQKLELYYVRQSPEAEER